MGKNVRMEWAALPLRLGLGLIFLVHGYPKFFETGIPGLAQWFGTLGIPLPFFFAVVVASVEFFGGILLLLGLLTRIVAPLLMVDMAVALWAVKVKFSKGFSGGYEFELLLLLAALALFFIGSGPFSLERNVLKKEF